MGKINFCYFSVVADHRFVEVFICQGDKCTALKSPPWNNLAKPGYRTLSQNMYQFAKIYEMPISLIHSCMFNNTKVQRAQKRHQPPRCTMQHPQNLQGKHSTVPAETLPLNLEECCLCENQASRAELH